MKNVAVLIEDGAFALFFRHFSRADPKKWLTCWKKENSGYDGIIFVIGKWKLIANPN